MKKIVILLITITSLFGQLKWSVDSSVVRQLYVLDENYIKHYPNQIEWKTENQKLFIYKIQAAMMDIKNGMYPPRRAKEITNVVERYVELKKRQEEELKSLKKELRELTK